jgi:hypothetical protein
MPEPPITERAKSWTILRPGESTYVSDDALGFESAGPGVYEFSGTYMPPSLTEEQLQILSNAGMYVPRYKAQTEKIRYVKSAH